MKISTDPNNGNNIPQDIYEIVNNHTNCAPFPLTCKLNNLRHKPTN
jgi:hypothetical protein